VLAELGMVLTDPGHRLADCPGHSGSSALGCGRGSSIATTQAKRVRELANEEVAFGVGLRGPLGVADGMRLVDVVVDLGEASAVGVLGSRVEDLAGVAECRARQAGRLAAVDLCTAAGLGGHEIQHVVLPARIGQEPREVSHALEVAHKGGVPFEGHRPVVTLAAKDVDAPNRLLVECVVVFDVHWWGNRRRGLDPFEDRADRLALQDGPVLAAAGGMSLGRPMRASAASYGAPTSFQSRTASDKACSAPAASPSASRTLPRATAALATSALSRMGTSTCRR
jgi:hypothetical protein